MTDANTAEALPETVRCLTKIANVLMNAGAAMEAERREALRATDKATMDAYGFYALALVCLHGLTELAKMLLAAGADKEARNMHGHTALMLASVKGHTETAQALLAAGAEKDAKDNDGNTALILASFKGHTDIVVMLAAGADKETKETKSNRGFTALMWASFHGHTETAQALLAKGADKEVKDNMGNTALMCASTNGQTEIAQALLAAGADKDAKNNKGSTALILASCQGHTEIVYLLSRRIMAASRIRRFCTDVCYNPTYNFAQRRILREVGYSREEIDAFMADKDAKSNYGCTALLFTIANGLAKIVRALMGVCD